MGVELDAQGLELRARELRFQSGGVHLLRSQTAPRLERVDDTTGPEVHDDVGNEGVPQLHQEVRDEIHHLVLGPWVPSPQQRLDNFVSDPAWGESQNMDAEPRRPSRILQRRPAP